MLVNVFNQTLLDEYLSKIDNKDIEIFCKKTRKFRFVDTEQQTKMGFDFDVEKYFTF